MPTTAPSLTVTVIDYGAGNVSNVQKALESVGCRATVSDQARDLERADALVLPGVGAFDAGMRELERRGLRDAMERAVLQRKKPLLGICLGMQLLSLEGTEGGRRPGLGFLPAKVRRLRADAQGLRIPHVGWNEVAVTRASILFAGIPDRPDFYFVHSYHVECEDPAMCTATCDYGHPFAAVIEHDNLFATQFHPEKSQRYGLQILRNFVSHCRSLAQRN